MLVAVVVVAVILSGVLTPSTTYSMVVHVFDNHYYPQTVYNVTLAMLIGNVTVTVAGVDQPSRLTPTGIILYDLPAGTYQITVSGNATRTSPYAYALGPMCVDQTCSGMEVPCSNSDLQCHALVSATGPIHPHP